MGFWKEMARRGAWLGRRSRFDRELDEELQFHLETRADELQQSGMSRGEALAQARREFGPAARMREETRAAWQFRWIEDLAADLRYAARAFRRNPAFALTAIACLALGTGANTTVFSIAKEMLFSQPSCRDPETLMHVRIGGNSHSPRRQYRFVRDAGIFAGLAGEFDEGEVNWRHGDATSRIFGMRVTENFFDLIGVPLAMGRGIQPGDSDVVVLTDRFWRSRLGGDPAVMGQTLILDGKPHSIVGVLPRDHRTLTGFGYSPDVYIPVSDDKTLFAFYARLPDGMTRPAAIERLRTVCMELDRVHPDGDHKWARNIEISSIVGLDRIRAESMAMSVAAFFAMLLVVVGLVLLIACANVASLLLARASSRSHEFAIRLSIGASRGRIIRQLLAECLLLAVCGTGAGLLLNIALTSALSNVPLPLPVPIQFLIQPDLRLLAYSVTIALGCTLAAGLAPAIQATRAGVSSALKQDQHQVGRGRWTLRGALVVAQLAVSVILLSAGFLFLRNLLQSASMNPGFDLDHTVWSYMRLVPEAYANPDKIRATVDAGLARLRALPGVESAAIARMVPLNDNNSMGAEMRTDLDARPAHVTFTVNRVGPDYFQTMRIPILAGREFLNSDRKGAPEVAILNQSFARRLFGSANPIGHTIRYEKGQPITIVGLAKDSKYFTLGEANRSALYTPYLQSPFTQVNLHFLVRSRLPRSILSSVNTTLLELDQTAAVDTRPMRDALGMALLPSRAGAALLGATGLLGLALACIGLYGVLLYAVSRRIREIGLRVALGATPAAVLRMVFGESLRMVLAGVGVGIALSILAVRPLAMFLVPEVHPTDATNFIVVATALSLVALLATAAPALKALRVDPVVALRHE